jgi:hypothetical protein
MRLPALLLFCLSLTANAQNWALLNPAYKYNYSNDGTDTISNQIRVMHVDTLGPDSFRYELNRVVELCDTCAGPNLHLWTDAPQFLQRTVNVGQSAWHFHGPGSFVVFPHAPLGASWLFDTLANVQATITSIDTVDQFGSDVPRKTIGLSTGEVLIISEEYGILVWGANTLIGAHGPEVGRLIPNIAAFFPFQPGDLVQYKTDYDNCCPFNGENSQYKFTFSGSIDQDTSIAYSGSKVAYTHNYMQYMLNGPIFHTYSYQNEAANWTAGSSELPFFDLVRSYPGQLVSTQVWYMQPDMACIAHHGIDSLGRYQVRCSVPGPGHFINPLPTGTEGLIQSFSEQLCMDDDPHCGALFAEGIGLVRYGGYFFETNLNYSMDGAVLSGDTIGSLLTDDQLLAIHDATPTNQWGLFPNPADDAFTVRGTVGVSTISIHDLEGRMVRTVRVSSENEMINVRDLQAGVYLVRIDGHRPQRLVIAR